ncbi:hypothetical protein BC834DRAFT_869090 [Gloeopeniophorella convolvens]|nr:hypothetical protein BC834DRAFT_869090 [Gloeopeniophorella convolvens]
MSGSSELSDALNPFAGQQRQARYLDQQQVYSAALPTAPVPTLAPFVPHRSELEYAIAEPPPPPKPRNDVSQVIQELLRALAATRQAQESENRRRTAWEQELEAKYHQRQAENETQLAEMKREIAYLKACVATLLHERGQSGDSFGRPGSPPLAAFPASGSGLQEVSMFAALDDAGSERQQGQSSMLVDLPSHSPSPAPTGRKRPTPSLSPEESDSDGSESDTFGSSSGERPSKRTNNHDKRCYTIQTAVRRHVYRVLGINPEDDLPPTHYEGLPLGDDEPVRFVWEKTVKQSKHNALMRDRVVADLKANRRIYRHVPDADFTPKAIAAAFDQAFSTFRQKYKAQMDPAVSLSVKTRGDQKAMKSRRLHRKKLKRELRISMREKTQAFDHPTFNAAMELECMSSEESDDESKPGVAVKDKVLVVRGLPWRSDRLLRFYAILDEDERIDKSLKPKRGLGRRERNEGPPKRGLTIPPKGVASWMISRRWLRDMQVAQPEVARAVRELVLDPPGFDWAEFDALGYETDDEQIPMDTALHTSYSLVDALAHT